MVKSLDKYRREFLGNVSHELKTPVFNIQGYVQTLIDGGLNDKTINMKYLKRANKSIDRMINIIQDLETITSLESDITNLEFKRINLKKLVKEVFAHLELKAKEKSIHLSYLQNTDCRYVYADRNKIFQVFVNLISNSIRYGKNGGKTKVVVQSDSKNMLVNVIDDGLGIKEKHLGRLFERFYRVDKNRSREQGGTGLGLAIVKHIIEAHDSKIFVSSVHGEGSDFKFKLSLPFNCC